MLTLIHLFILLFPLLYIEGIYRSIKLVKKYNLFDTNNTTDLPITKTVIYFMLLQIINFTLVFIFVNSYCNIIVKNFNILAVYIISFLYTIYVYSIIQLFAKKIMSSIYKINFKSKFLNKFINNIFFYISYLIIFLIAYIIIFF